MMERIIHLISEVGGIDLVSPDANIYEAGFSSIRVLELLLALEEEFGVSIPDKDFMAARSPRQINALIDSLRERQMA